MSHRHLGGIGFPDLIAKRLDDLHQNRVKGCSAPLLPEDASRCSGFDADPATQVASAADNALSCGLPCLDPHRAAFASYDLEPYHRIREGKPRGRGDHRQHERHLREPEPARQARSLPDLGVPQPLNQGRWARTACIRRIPPPGTHRDELYGLRAVTGRNPIPVNLGGPSKCSWRAKVLKLGKSTVLTEVQMLCMIARRGVGVTGLRLLGVSSVNSNGV